VVHAASTTTTATTLMMEAAHTSETSVLFYQTKWHYNPEESHLHSPLGEPQIVLH
jgi:hypothetical protein